MRNYSFDDYIITAYRIRVILDFHENVRFPKTRSEYQQQPYPLEKTTIVFLDPPRKMHLTFLKCSWNNQGIFLYSIFPEHYFGIFPGIS